METIFHKVSKSSEHVIYFVFRVMVGLLFSFHGMQKLGWFSGPKGALSPAMFAGFMHLPVWTGYLVAYVELLAGFAIMLGLFSRLVAIIAGIDMIAALFIAHFPQGWNPILTGSELAFLYLLAFLVIFAMGSGKWALERAMCKNECF